MATDSPSAIHDRWDECPDCGRPTRHAEFVEIRTRRSTDPGAAFSRRPYRVAECLVCGCRRSFRMGDDSAG